MNSRDLRNLQLKHDYGWAKFVVEEGYPNVAPILTELIGWLKDMNDYDAQILAPFLASIGKPLIPHLKAVFDSNNEAWKCYVLWHIVAESPEIAEAFRQQIEKYALTPTEKESAEGLDEISREILNKLKKTD